MIIGTTTDLLRVMSTWIRKADSGLVSSAARNAAHSIDAQQFRQLDDARTLRDLESIPPATMKVAEPRPAAHAYPR